MKPIKPCPICGRMPKAKYEYIPSGCFIRLRCKKLFFNKHNIEAECGGACESWAYEKVVIAWNEQVAKEMKR